MSSIRFTDGGQGENRPAPGQARELEIGRDPGGNTGWGQYIRDAIRAAQDGDHITLTRHGTPVARLSPVRAGDWGTDEILAAIRVVDAHLDAATSPAYRDQPLAGHWSRIGKAAAEAQEAIEALGGVTGENPRKGTCDTWDHVMEELGDTACAALLGIQHITKDTGATWAVFLAALSKALGRVPEGKR